MGRLLGKKFRFKGLEPRDNTGQLPLNRGVAPVFSHGLPISSARVCPTHFVTRIAGRLFIYGGDTGLTGSGGRPPFRRSFA
jgi:hypothetical protein